MNHKRLTFVAMLVLSSTTAFADAQMKSDAQSVDQACATDAATAGCGSDQVGHGLLKCLDAYKKSHPETKESESCVTARKQMHQDRKARKAAKAAAAPAAAPAN